jgi:hypothetical protein
VEEPGREERDERHRARRGEHAPSWLTGCCRGTRWAVEAAARSSRLDPARLAPRFRAPLLRSLEPVNDSRHAVGEERDAVERDAGRRRARRRVHRNSSGAGGRHRGLPRLSRRQDRREALRRERARRSRVRRLPRGHLGYPHPEHPAAPDCATCHEDAARTHAASVHGAPHEPGGPPRASCTDCHGDAHAIVARDDPGSPVAHARRAATCARCHASSAKRGALPVLLVRPVESYLESVHARAVTAGKNGATCSDCHGSHAILPLGDSRSRLARPHVAETCGACHADVAAAYRDSNPRGGGRARAS